jgi:pyrimidine operon attenuation protein/uracil phosphoribosyltransferase
MTPKKILNANELSTILHRLCFQLIEDHNDFSETVLVGIQPRGIQLANRLLKLLADNDKNNKIDLGLLDITFFRDDFRRNEKSLKASATKLDFSIENKTIILIDDFKYHVNM